MYKWLKWSLYVLFTLWFIMMVVFDILDFDIVPLYLPIFVIVSLFFFQSLRRSSGKPSILPSIFDENEYWLKYGKVLVLIFLIFITLSIPDLYEAFGPGSLSFGIYENSFTKDIIDNPLGTIFFVVFGVYILFGIPGSLVIFSIGAIIGLIVAKFKKKKIN